MNRLSRNDTTPCGVRQPGKRLDKLGASVNHESQVRFGQRSEVCHRDELLNVDISETPLEAMVLVERR